MTVAERVRELVDRAPPLKPEQRHRLRVLLGTGATDRTALGGRPRSSGGECDAAAS